jgi:hypothetical protein
MVLSKLKYPSLRSRPAQGKSLARGWKVSDASDFFREARGRFPTRRDSYRLFISRYLIDYFKNSRDKIFQYSLWIVFN